MEKINREELLLIINKIIVEESGEEVTEDQLLTDSQIDSFGYAMLWLGLGEEFKKRYNILLPKIFIENIDYDVFKVKDLIDELESIYNEC